MAVMQGIDISAYQNGIDLVALKKSNPALSFVIIKATQGNWYPSPSMVAQINSAKAAGLSIGLYHFADTKNNSTAVQQADYFYSRFKDYLGQNIIPALDWEADILTKGTGWANDWFNELYRLIGVYALHYMSKSTTTAYDWTAIAKNHGGWIAQYANYARTGFQSSPWTDKNSFGAFKSLAVYQYSSAGELAGWAGNLDMDIFYGDKTTWNKYAAKSGVAPSVAPAVTGNKYKVGQFVTVIPRQTKNNVGYDISKWVGAKIQIKKVRGKTGAVVYDGVVGTNPYNDLKESNIEEWIDPATINPVFTVGEQVQISPKASKEYLDYDLTPRRLKIGNISKVTKLPAKYSRSWFYYEVQYPDKTHNVYVLEQDLIF